MKFKEKDIEGLWQQRADMAMLIRRLVNRLKKYPDAKELCDQSIDYLRRNSLKGSILRGGE